MSLEKQIKNLFESILDRAGPNFGKGLTDQELEKEIRLNDVGLIDHVHGKFSYPDEVLSKYGDKLRAIPHFKSLIQEELSKNQNLEDIFYIAASCYLSCGEKHRLYFSKQMCEISTRLLEKSEIEYYMIYIELMGGRFTREDLIQLGNLYVQIYERDKDKIPDLILYKYLSGAGMCYSLTRDNTSFSKFYSKYRKDLQKLVRMHPTFSKELKKAALRSPIKDQFLGTIIGSVVGDALGGPVEFMNQENIKAKYGNVEDMIGGGVHNLQPGEYTDDTQTMLLLMESIIENNGFDPNDYAKKLIQWKQNKPKDIGNLTRRAISYLEKGWKWKNAGKKAKKEFREMSAGNGSLMRTYPIALLHYNDREKLFEDTRRCSVGTHANRLCIESCYLLNYAVSELILGFDISPESLLKAYSEIGNDQRITTMLKQLNTFPKDPKGYVVDTLHAAFWSLFNSDFFEEGIIKVVNLGADADTNAAVAGSLLGAKYGYSQIPQRWVKSLSINPKDHNYIINITNKFYSFIINQDIELKKEMLK